MPEEKPTIETVSLPTGGPVAGIPDSHVGPGNYLINWVERTITPVVQAVEAEVEQVVGTVKKPKKAAAPVETPTPDAAATSETAS